MSEANYSEMEFANGLAALRELAAIGIRARSESPVTQLGLDAIKNIIEYGRSEAARGSAHLAQAVAQSAACFPGLGEPLAELDFSQHRWIGAHREEAYSDWLAWIISNLSVTNTLKIFGVRSPAVLEACETADWLAVFRETPVKQGHEHQTGRLDLDIDLGGKARLVIELKVVAADQSDTAKQAGYCRSIEQSTLVPFECVLVAVSPGDEDYCGFRGRCWSDVCLSLRSAASELLTEGHGLSASMTLSFVAAVEQNLLHLGWSTRTEDLANGLRNVAMAKHLVRFVAQTEE